jgi:O-antigen biosynthesis protein
MSQVQRLRHRLKDAAQALKQRLRSVNRQRLYRRRIRKGSNYALWLEAFEAAECAKVAKEAQAWLSADTCRAVVCIKLLTTERDRPEAIAQTISSISQQRYPRWTCQVEGSHAPQHPAALHGASNDQAIDWVCYLRPGDELHPLALLRLMQAAQQHAHARLIYANEDALDEKGRRTAPHFKPEWNPQLQWSTHYIGRACLFKADAQLDVGTGDDHDDYVRILKAASACSPDQIVHIPAVLWHLRMDSSRRLQATHASVLEAHWRPFMPGVQVKLGPEGTLHLLPPNPAQPLVSILICTRNQVNLLRKCIESILTRTSYPNFEIIIVDNGSDEARALAYLAQLPGQHPQIRVIRDASPFNYSALNNLAAQHARGEVLALLNNDIEVISPDWLSEMVALAITPGHGCVGAKLLYPDQTIQHAGVLVGGGTKVDGVAIATHCFKGLPGRAPGYQRRAIATQNVSAVTGACLVVRRDLFDQVGGLNAQELAVAFNDVDFCLRIAALGLRHVWSPHALLYHHESISRGRDVIAPEKLQRLKKESHYMRQHWRAPLQHDACYPRGLDTLTGDYLLPQSSDPIDLHDGQAA